MKLINLFESVFDKTTTEMSKYDDMLKNPDYFAEKKGLQFRILTMSPDEYIERAVKGFNSTKEKMLRSRDLDKVEKYSKKMKAGEKFPMLTLDHSQKSFTQEGIHRSMAAIKAGIDSVPVMVVDSIK